MSDFSNFYSATVDDKGRVVLPAQYKRGIAHDTECWITVEIDPYDPCLNLYPEQAWNKRIGLIKSKVNPNDPRQSRFLDKFYQSFVRINMADNGRLNIPNHFLHKKNIEKEVVFSGQGDRIRLWDAENYRQAMMPDEDYPSMFEEFLGGNLTGF